MRFKAGDIIRRQDELDKFSVEILKVTKNRYRTCWRFTNETSRIHETESEFPDFWILDETCKVKQIMEQYA